MRPLRNAVGDFLADETGSLNLGGKARNVSTGSDAPYNSRSIAQELEARYPGRVTSSTVPPANAKMVRMAGDQHEVTGVVYDQKGFPVFDNVAVYETRIPQNIASVDNPASHMRAATRSLRESIEGGQVSANQFTSTQIRAIRAGEAKIPDLTWHHHQDFSRMQLVPTRIHKFTGHVGGEAMWFEQ